MIGYYIICVLIYKEKITMSTPITFIKNVLCITESPDTTQRTKAELESPDPPPEKVIVLLNKDKDKNE